MFRNVPAGPPDPVYILKTKVDADKSPEKVDLGVGVFRNEKAECHELQAVKASKKAILEQNLGHDYEVTTGNPEFVQKAAAVLFGSSAEVIQSKRLTSVQGISGTGAIHTAALFLSRVDTLKDKKVYVGTPAWGNYEPLFNLVGFTVEKYRHYDAEKGVVDFQSLLSAISSAPKGSIFILQGCCHNPTGADLTKDQWRTLAKAMQEKELFPFFDMAYQGLGGSLDDDAFSLRLFTEKGFELVACQSFSKNFGIYGERCGVAHVVSANSDAAQNVHDQLRSLIRWEFSSSPAYGARIVTTILRDSSLTEAWSSELSSMRERLVVARRDLYEAIVNKRKTPGDWSVLLSTTGLFCFLPLTPKQTAILGNKYHVYMLGSGRINVSGINPSNVERIATAIDEVVRSAVSSNL
ncbi:aspartate aminotransferase [Aaosphaeria arxii CBS 175.79]|uniref:Aspartate aminotransferase n=1 Tax=Aaosphaeria arxii CBS 175.79 TaxID=1450172 RepID=A0A6A5Y2H5_9PLEO|nr:aspartate aminotransferase [Aaosphaeria arxii CBS 175.79]KAF2019449.1 aspartate aminotransferase [Aaosphaeria arxii CBS 175.79]